MPGKWQVVATYIPQPRLVKTKVYYQETVETVVPPGAGMTWKFTVLSSGVTAAEAIEAVKQSGFFCGDLVKQFWFSVNKEMEKV